MKQLLAATLVTAALVGCGSNETLSFARWRPMKVLGKEKTFYSAHDGGEGTAMNRSYFPVVGGWGESRGLNDIAWGFRPIKETAKFENQFHWKGKEKIRNKLPYGVFETMGPDVPYNTSREQLKNLHAMRPDAPFLLRGFLDSWSPWYMKDKYDCDVQSYRDFCKTYTNFVAIVTLNESDGGFGSFKPEKIEDPKIRAEVCAAFPPAKSYRDRVLWVRKAMERQKAIYFGSDRFYSLYSSNSKWGHVLAKYGVSMLGYECESQVLSGPWRFSMAHVRGVARQYQLPWTWYAAHLIESYTRDGQLVDGEWHLPNQWRAKEKWPKAWRENSGTARSIIKRAMVYGYFSGANVLALENPHYFLMDDLDGKPKLSKYGRDFEDVMQMAEKTPRGICYTPVAALTSVYRPFGRSGNNGYATDAFFFTLVPVLSEDGYKHRDAKKGEQGILFNSEFGEICDVLTPDAAQKPGDFAAALAPYRWAFMMGPYDERDFERGAVLGWVNAGGTLVTSVDYVEQGLVTPNMAGVAFTDKTVTCGERLIEASTKRTLDGSMRQTFRRTHNNRDYRASLDYELHVGAAKTAKPLYVDENGNVIAWENRCGKGTVIALAAVQGVPRIFTDRTKYRKELPIDDFFGVKPEIVAGRVTYPVQRELLRKVQRETLPVAVEGDVQWGVNFVEKSKGTRAHWLVWLLNNKGVKKFACEEETVDHAFDARVRIRNRKTGKSVEVVVPAGGYRSVQL